MEEQRPSGRRAMVMELSPAQRHHMMAPRTPAQSARNEMINAHARLADAVNDFTLFDRTGHPEDWLAHVAVVLDDFLVALVGFQREINAVVASDPYFAAVRERQNLERIELHEDGTPGAVLQDALRLSEGASVEAARVVRRMIHAVQDPGVDISSSQPSLENETLTSVMQNDVAHAQHDNRQNTTALGTGEVAS
ncbi:hypothetical protein [Corynebacterium lipophiloflavum]|uniref:hypothetical protein n=1 Tax=Corynebacterium lipophiloflavum TaxID=161889 RepID=UPI00058F36D6|nr:hypothetical protein [Corynebacterium lipophiloflavum]